MSISRVIFNVLLALALALPLTAVENAYTAPEKEPPPNVQAAPPPTVQSVVPTSFGTSPDLIGLVADKVSKPYHVFPNENKYDDIIEEIAAENGISPALIKSIIRAESNFQPGVVSPMGAVGLMQVMPNTARRFGVPDATEPRANILAGTRFLKMLLEMFHDDETLALAAYNSGPARVKRYGRIPPIRETRIFVDQVMFYYLSYLTS